MITAGGTYSGTFSSDDPNVPAVSILTTAPVILENATLSSRGDLIHILSAGIHVGSNVTIRNVTGTALDPGVAGLHRGAFVRDEEVNTLSVTNCTMTGVSFGIYVAPIASAGQITLDNNMAFNMEDRPSDGNGNLVASREMKGHFIQLNEVPLTKGADIGWNQVIDTPGEASVEDIIDIAQSQGTAANPINIHDNYLEGAFSTGTSGYDYTGGGIMNEGIDPSFALTNAFVTITNNVVVHTANYGIGLAYGHDITETNNRVVSCGVDSNGVWYEGLSGIAFGIANFTSPYFYNNHISGATGGLVRPATVGGAPLGADYWAPSLSTANNNTMTGSAFDDPCWTSPTTVSNQAEIVERTKWNAKVLQAQQVLGDTHTQQVQ
ncbi:hypothetical protein SAMN05421819_4125 [Bryocella elongata]|uniref:Right handed beta helix region n=2 Tax=Bryocella elongata TaxID=863522 RepID=A0A1H6C130_9BACT|nr:hypothetical protein SAMN05421819_4125 [Bryocella elongata]